MFRNLCFVMATVALPLRLSLQAQDWRARLGKDLVEIRDSTMVYNEIGLLKFSLPGYQTAQYQVKLHSESPVEGPMSRDNFVALTATTALTFLQTAFAQAYQVTAAQFLEAMDLTELEAPIGTPDLELNLVMTKQGMQFEFVNTTTGQRQRQTSTWEQVYEE